MTRTGNVIDLRELSLGPGERTERVFQLEIAPVALGGVPFEVVVDEAGVTVWVQRIAGGHLVGVSLGACIYGSCARCLDEVVLHLSADQEEFVPRRPDEWDEADISPFIEDSIVDVDGLSREALVLALPSKLLCDESCRGLCPDCGRPLGSEVCDCAPQTGDERWARLADLTLDGTESA